MPAALVALGLTALAFLLVRYGAAWVYRVWDRSLRNRRDRLPRDYELPRYYRPDAGGAIDYAAPWPGMDGWYFVVLLDDPGVPLKTARASITTGLYGVDGIDNADRLPPGTPGSLAAEYLCLTSTAAEAPAGAARRDSLVQRYLPRAGHLRMSLSELAVALSGGAPREATRAALRGEVRGSWPEYRFSFHQPGAEISLDLRFQGEDLGWWADVPGLFTYVACFGRFEGTVSFRREQGAPGRPLEESHAVRGRGAFEHGFGRQLVDLEKLYAPIRGLRRVFRSFRPFRYHYELLLGDERGAHHGGLMHARAFGVDVRNHGALTIDGRRVTLRDVRITYHDAPPPDVLLPKPPEPAPITFYRRWTVEATTDEGVLTYTAERDRPPPRISANMAYYEFRYEGTYLGVPIRGRGYGEYAHL